MSAIFSIGTFLALFISVLLFTKRARTLPDKILGIWMCIIGVHILTYHFNYLGFWAKYPHLFGTTAFFPLLHAPMLFLYISYSLNGKEKFNIKDFLHFTPTALSYIHIFEIVIFYSAEEKLMLDNGEIDDSLFIGAVLTVLIISVIVYTILAYRKFRKFSKILKTNFSFDRNINFKWLRYWIIGCSAVFGVVTLVTIIRDALGIELGFNADLVFYTMFILLIMILGYFGIVHQGIFTESNIVVEEKQKESYQKSRVKKNEAKKINAQLLEIMLEQKVYLNPKLTLAELANTLNTSANNLSQVINQYEKVNFFDFVNTFRIEEFKQQAKKNPHFSILALALEAGFNSKSSFNSLFKKHTGQTPSQFLIG